MYDAGETQKQLEISTNGNESLMDIVNRLNVEMEKCIQINELIKYLKRYSLLVTHEEEKLRNKLLTSTEKIQDLLLILRSKGPDGVKNFVKALYDSANESNVPGHDYLVKHLQRAGVIIKLTKTTQV